MSVYYFFHNIDRKCIYNPLTVKFSILKFKVQVFYFLFFLHPSSQIMLPINTKSNVLESLKNKKNKKCIKIK